MRKISKSQFKPKALQYFREVEATGEGIVITDHGMPVLQLVRFEPKCLAVDDRESLG